MNNHVLDIMFKDLKDIILVLAIKLDAKSREFRNF